MCLRGRFCFFFIFFKKIIVILVLLRLTIQTCVMHDRLSIKPTCSQLYTFRCNMHWVDEYIVSHLEGDGDGIYKTVFGLKINRIVIVLFLCVVLRSAVGKMLYINLLEGTVK